MSLLDDLRHAAKSLDPQFQPQTNELQSILGALLVFAEHGEKFLTAAKDGGTAGVSELVAPAPPAAEAPPVPAAPPAAEQPVNATPATDAELEAQISDLQARLAARQATEQHPVVEHQTGDPAPPAPPAWPAVP